MPLRRQGSYDASAQAEIIAGDPFQGSPTLVPGDLTPSPSSPGWYMLQKASAAAVTLGAPVSGADDTKSIVFQSDSAQAHVVTATGLLQTGSASVNTATFAANSGANVVLMAWQGKWKVISSVGVTFG